MSKSIKSQTAILSKLGIDTLNPMQMEAQLAIESCSEVILLSPTGTGKTLAFLLPLINELDLIKAINSKTIFGAGLDVFEKEPLDPQHPLRSMDNVLLTPHNSNSAPGVREYVHENTVNNLLTGLGII